MWVVVGLGNPGAAYADTRHNVGFMVIESLARRWGVVLHADGARSRSASVERGGTTVQLVQPQTYMNRSAEALDALWPGDTVIAVYDDLDLPVGQIRIRAGGGTGGHRGVASLVERLGSEFPRVRVGIGRPPGGVSSPDYVLAPMTPLERPRLEAAVARAGDAIECMLSEGVVVAMNRFNAKPAGLV
jgi:peptidyl-tRNA hydrolase, PTH1 family